MNELNNSQGDRPLVVEFSDNRLFSVLCGEHDRHLARIEQKLGVSLTPRGNRVAVFGSPSLRRAAESVLRDLYQRAEKGLDLGEAEVDGAVRMALADETGQGPAQPTSAENLIIRTKKRQITPRSPTQATYVARLHDAELVFGIGPAGTGKTYLAVATAVEMLLRGEVDRIILARPAVEAGERLGFLPGDMRDKVDPYLRPLYDALYDMLPGDQVASRLESGEIEVAPLAFMRGRTLAHSFVILDEAQNTTPVQMKMLLTRLGENSRMAVTGDLSQIDLPKGTRSGLRDAVEVLDQVKGVAFVQFSDQDVVRHPLVTRVVRAYDSWERKGRGER